MSSAQNVGNNVGAVNDFQPFMDAPNLEGAHGKRSIQQNSDASTNALACTSKKQTFDRMDQLQSEKKVPTNQLTASVTSSGNASNADGIKTSIQVARNNILQVKNTFTTLLNRPNISSEAKAVYSAALVILDKIANCTDFSAANIQNAIDTVLTQAATTTGLKGTVGFFRKSIDEGNNYGSKTGQPSLCVKKDGKKKTDHPKCINACKNLELSMWGIDTPKNIQNVQITDITLDSNETNDLIEVYNVQFNNNIGKPFKMRCPKGFPIKEYMDQLCAESNSYSGDITIKKAEPGSVFVRVFGKEQSPLRSCWCNAADDKSAVTEAKDLYDKLAVKFEWNGDGNMAVLVVPNDIEIYFAEGTIASQTGDYSEKTLKGKEEVEQKHTYIYQGGGTQTNILAKNVSEGYRPFADLKGEREKIWQQIMFVFRDDGIIDMEKLSQDPTQNPQQNEQK